MKYSRKTIICTILLLSACQKKPAPEVPSAVTGISANSDTATTDGPVPNSPVTANQKALPYNWYYGAWFRIQYPQNFSVKNSQISATADAFDSAVFTSPDGQVEFYIYSPQWAGVAKDLNLHAGQIKSKISVQINQGITIRRWTVTTKNNSQVAAYEQTDSDTSTKIFGFRYNSVHAREKYLEQYLHFKNSLEQYAD